MFSDFLETLSESKHQECKILSKSILKATFCRPLHGSDMELHFFQRFSIITFCKPNQLLLHFDLRAEYFCEKFPCFNNLPIWQVMYFLYFLIFLFFLAHWTGPQAHVGYLNCRKHFTVANDFAWNLEKVLRFCRYVMLMVVFLVLALK